MLETKFVGCKYPPSIKLCYSFQIDQRLTSAAVSLIYFIVIYAIQLKTPKALEKIKREKTLIFAFSIVIGFGFAINFLLRLVLIF